MDATTSSGLFVPTEFGSVTEGRGEIGEGLPEAPAMATVVNETDFSDSLILDAARDHFVENASMAWGHRTNFQMYSNQQGSLLARSDYKTPTSVIEEIKLARDLAERDDDVRAVMGAMIAIAFGEGMENFHEDERTMALFNSIAREANLDGVLKDIYREYLIASQFTTASLFTRTNLDFTPGGNGDSATESVASPLVGILPSENIRVIGNDMFGTGILAYDPPDARLREWLDEFFNPDTSPARKAEMGREDRVAANLFTGIYEVDPMAPNEDRPGSWGYDRLYLLNPRMCQRTTMPKGSWKHPRPLLTADFALLEAKRLLNIMDFALLQGGSNFIVVAKKGTDERPAVPAELENLKQVVRHASRSGVIVGDHRLSFDIITPDLKELLNSSKRRLLGRKIAMALLRTPERAEESAGSQNEQSDIEITQRVVTSDRQDIKRHMEGNVYAEVVRRNKRLFPKGGAKLWFPKIILQGAQWFTDLVLKLRDRGDISRSTAVAAGGFDWDSEVQARKREIARGDDDIMQPGSVPHSSPEAGPQDNNEGRPPGSRDGRPTNDPARPRPVIQRTPGETVRSWYDEDEQAIVRCGETTFAILEEFPDRSIGRLTAVEREAAEATEAYREGAMAILPVNPGVRLEDLKAVRLREGLSMIVGNRIEDGAIMARAVCFREPEWSARDAENTVVRWGFPMGLIPETTGEVDDDPAPSGDPVPEETAAAPQPVELHVHTGGKRILLRDSEGNIIGSEPAEDPDPKD